MNQYNLRLNSVLIFTFVLYRFKIDCNRLKNTTIIKLLNILYQMKKILLILTSIIFILLGCKTQEILPDQGSLYISVKDQYGRIVSGANITGNPAIPESNTDNFGSVLVKNLNVGTYELIANKAQYGSGKAVAVVKTNDVTSVNIGLEYGVYASFAPTAKIAFPVQPANYAVGESILFKAYVADNDTPLEKLTVRWESSVDGLINESNADKDGVSTFSTTKLSANSHIIRLIVKDQSGNVGRDSILVSTLSPKEIKLETPNKVDGSLVLNWSKSTESDFKEYRIYRANQNCDEMTKSLIGVVQDASKNTFTDTRPPFSTKSCYFVEIVTNTLRIRRSNQQQVEYPAGLFFDYSPKDVAIHPTKPWLYLSRQDKGIVVVYDYEKAQVITEVATPQHSGYLLVANNGSGLNLYIPSANNTVNIFDATTFELKKTLLTTAPATDVAVSGTGDVFVTLNDQWTNPIVSFTEVTGLIQGGTSSYGCIYGGARLRKIPNQSTLMTISTSISPTDMDLIFYDSQGKLLSCKDDSQHGDYPLDPNIFCVSPKGNYVLTSASGAAYLTNESMKYLGTLKGGDALNYSDFAFNADGSVFYGATSNRQSIQIGKYPELTRTNEILCKGFPYKIFVKGNNIISLSRTELNVIYTAVEIVKIP